MSLRSEYVIPAIRSAPKAARTLTDEEMTAALRALPYERYLRTKWWFSRRNRALRLASYRCHRCGSRRELQVHHLSYERIGCEADEDLEVVCRGCHLGEHYEAVQSHVALYARVLSEVITEGRLHDVPDVLEEAKQRCASRNIPYRHDEFSAAAARVLPRIPFKPAPNRAELFATGEAHEPLSKAEAAAAILRLKAAGLIRHMPEVRPLTRREADRKGALEIVAQAILAQVEACEAAERPESVKL
jgi:hypothetical protein